MARSGNTRTITQKKVYEPYRLTMAVEIDRDYTGKDWRDIVAEAEDRFEVFFKTGNNERKAHLMARDRLPHAVFDRSMGQSATPKFPFELWEAEFVLEDVKITVSEVCVPPLELASEAVCNEYLDRLREGNLLIDGYSYESKYGEWFVFCKQKFLHLTGCYWMGGWK